MQDVTPIVFECCGEQLAGLLHAPAKMRGGFGVVVVVGGPQYRVGSHRQFVLLARALADAGIPCLRFDYRGMGDSDGEARTFESVDADIRAAVDVLVKSCPAIGSVVLWGLCDAASACMTYAPTDPRVDALIVANPWVRTEVGIARSYLKNYYLQRVLQRGFWAKVFKGQFELGRSLSGLFGAIRTANRTEGEGPSAPFIDRMLDGWLRFNGRTLVFVSGQDLTAGEFTALVASHPGWRKAANRTSVSRIDLPTADHTFSRRELLDRVNRECVSWLVHANSQAA